MSKINTTTRIIAIAALFLSIFAVSGFAMTNHINAVYKQKDDRYRLLALKTDTDHKKMITAHNTEIANVKLADNKALKHAVSKQHNHDVRVMQRAIRRQKVAARRAATAAQSAGYANGHSAGYNSGHSDGEVSGLVEGSDQLDCSDDPDVYWLPNCD